MIAVLVSALLVAVWFAFASQETLRGLGDPVPALPKGQYLPRFPEIRKDVDRASRGESLAILLAELEHDFDHAGLAFVEYWNPGAELLSIRFRLLNTIGSGCTTVAPFVSRWAIRGMADIAEWAFRASAFVPVGRRR